MMVGNHCADIAATAALHAIPQEIRHLSDSIAAHIVQEERNFHDFL
jgi:hypothetical protein